MNLFIGNLDYSIREQQLRELFEPYGEVTSAKVITDKMSGRSKGYGFVEMSNDAEGEQAINALNGQMVKNRNISVTQARPRPEGGNQ